MRFEALGSDKAARVAAMVPLVLAGTLAVFSGCSAESRGEPEEAPGPERPSNVLVISVCSIRADHMSLYGYPRITTPNLDRLAAGAWVFDHAVTPWSKTTPAFAAILTGQYGHDTGVMRITPGQRLDDSHTTLAEILRDRGYDTAAFISSGALNRGTNIFQQGFEYVEETFRVEDPFTTTTEHALEWMRRERTGPFLAWVHYNNAHQPYYAPGAPPDLFVDDDHYVPSLVLELNDDQPLDLPVPADHPARDQILRQDMWGVRPSVVLRERPRDLAFYMARYDAGIYGADRMIGELLAGLRAQGLQDETVIAVVGDHGESLGDHGYFFGHGRLPYDACARVPLLIRAAGQTEGRRVRVPVSTLGLVPSLLESVGLPVAPSMAVPSLLPIARGEKRGGLVFAESGYSMEYPLSVRDQRWKLIFVPNPIDRSLMLGQPYELYDLETDPEELNDLYDERPEEARRLRRALARWARPWLSGAYERPPQANEIVDEPTRRQLKAMGYLD